MKKENKKSSLLIIAIVFIVSAAVLRLVPHIPNFAPITAMALFGGAYLNKRFALIVPLMAMIISDYLLLYVNPFGASLSNFSELKPLSALFHSSTSYVWSSFLLSGLIGIWLRGRKKPLYIIAAAAFTSIQFFIITNFGVWASGFYSRGFDGLLQSYIMGLPFFRGTLIGDIVYTSIFFGAYELAIRMVKKPRLAIAH